MHIIKKVCKSHSALQSCYNKYSKLRAAMVSRFSHAISIILFHKLYKYQTLIILYKDSEFKNRQSEVPFKYNPEETQT